MPVPETIEISYSKDPPGQVGTKPRKIKKNTIFRITTKDPGVFTIEFTNGSPLANGSTTPSPNTDLAAAKTGKFPFKCTLDGKVIQTGGEVEVGPD